MEAASEWSSGHRSEQIRLRQALVVSVGFCLVLGGFRLFQPQPSPEAALWLGYAGCILYAQRRLRYRQIGRSIVIVGVAALAAGLVSALALAVARPELLAVPLALPMLALLYTPQPSLRRVLLIMQVVAGLLLSLAARLPLGLQPYAALLFTGMAATELALLLWLLTRRQTKLLGMLAEARASNARLQRAYEQLEAEMQARTEALHETEARIRAMNQQLSQNVSELQQHAYELAVLSDLNDSIQACVSTTDAYTVIIATLERLFPEGSGALEIAADDQSTLEVVGSWGQPAGPASATRALRVPLIARGTAFGVLSLDGGPEQASDARQHLVFTIARQIELSLANLRLQEKLRHQSIRDPLTGLFNRRYMEESFEREVSRASRSGYPIGVLMLDIDHFKHFNDTFGHDAGDMLLREVGAALQAGVRAGDIVCRYGGEEFTIIMPATTREKLLERAEQLREIVKQMQIVYLGEPLGAITISAGAALLPAHGPNPRAVLGNADAALYRAKHNGRDQVIEAQIDQDEGVVDTAGLPGAAG
ncbi:MAG TPA: diguanylate cyclase [Kouleothrix sp.]|uniref:GGDEF domain-containing protein n=1 Tax=Kouleothrix sp. TaxID=2779161 RepID=UPI002B70C1C5|nr:diguanylate cyclase [Kouleothrix sp.]